MAGLFFLPWALIAYSSFNFPWQGFFTIACIFSIVLMYGFSLKSLPKSYRASAPSAWELSPAEDCVAGSSHPRAPDRGAHPAACVSARREGVTGLLPLLILVLELGCFPFASPPVGRGR